MELTAVKERHPEPHRRYVVKRGGRFFVASPCYGMHAPWWVPSGVQKNGDPVAFEEGDQWVALGELGFLEG